MRKRYVTFRVSDAEYQALKAEAEKAGTSVPLHARRLALDSIQLAPRLEAIERQLKSVPDRGAMLEAFQRLSKKIDSAWAGKGGAA